MGMANSARLVCLPLLYVRVRAVVAWQGMASQLVWFPDSHPAYC